jgi:predicted phage terminase large subunit-like protein
MYPLLDGKANNSDLFWTFPASGAHIGFGHLQHEPDMYSHQGKEYALIGFDELDHFTESQFWYLFSRNRTTCGVRPVIRATINPNPEHFAKKLIAWWLDSEGRYPDLAKAGQLRWFVRDEQANLIWHDDNEEEFYRIVRFYRSEIDPNFTPTSLTFIPASVDDNPSMPKSYKAKLMALPMIERQRLLYGDWKIRPSAGTLFRSEWFQMGHRLPDGLRFCRYWDRAATEKKQGNDPDYTAGVLMARTPTNTYWVVDVKQFRGTPMDVEKNILSTANQDRELYGRVEVGIEQDPGQAGKFEASHYTRLLAGHVVKLYPAKQSKIKRAEPFSAQCEAGNVFLMQGNWNQALMAELEQFPDGSHDDQVDACSGAFNALANATNRFSGWQ